MQKWAAVESEQTGVVSPKKKGPGRKSAVILIGSLGERQGGQLERCIESSFTLGHSCIRILPARWLINQVSGLKATGQGSGAALQLGPSFLRSPGKLS